MLKAELSSYAIAKHVDDATGRLMELRFAVSESTFSYFDATRRYLERHGKPVAFYSDKASNAQTFMDDYNRRFAREPQSSRDAHRTLLEHENLDRLFRWQEERRVTQNLTLHYQRVMYLLEPNELSRAAAGKRVLVSETNDGKVVIEHAGKTLPARAFAKESRVTQAAIADNKVLGPMLAEIQRRQEGRDAHTLATKRLSLREEDLMRRNMGQAGLPARRSAGRPTTVRRLWPAWPALRWAPRQTASRTSCLHKQ